MSEMVPPPIQERLAKTRLPQFFSEVVFVSGQINADMEGSMKSAYIKIVFMDGDNGMPQTKVVMPLATATSLMKLIAQHSDELVKKLKSKHLGLENKKRVKNDKGLKDSASARERETVDRYVR